MPDEYLDPAANSVMVAPGTSGLSGDGSSQDYRDPGGSTYPDMTPRPSIMRTGAPARPQPDANQSGSLWDTFTRPGTEMKQAYQDTPPLVGPAARDWISNQGWFGRNVLGPAADVADFAVKGGSAVGAGLMANASELLSGGNPQLARDIHAGLTIAPVLASGVPSVAPMVASKEPYTGGAPLERVPIKSPEDALAVTQPFYKGAEGSNFQLKPQFTSDFVDNLDTYRKQTPAGLAVEGPNAATDLINTLSKTAKAPMDSIKSIQEVEGTIQSAISKEYGPNGLSAEGKQMRQMLQDFRDRYTNVSDDQFTGNPKGIEDFRNGIKGYAAYSRMRDLQGVVDSTEGNSNRATLIASRVNGFLNDPKNIRGWTDDEVAAARRAANSGFFQEWMRAEGSRLVGIGAGVVGGLGGAAIGVPIQVGLSYAVRNAAENMRLAQMQKALGVLGQRVPQPGTVPPQPPPYMPPRSLVTTARYAPLTGLLGQSTDSQGQ